MMSPSNTKKEILKKLRQTRKEMMSAAWTNAIRKKPVDVRREAALKLLDINDAIHELQNANLDKIRNKLIANETELLDGTANLSQALDTLNQVKKVLITAGKLLDVVAKVVKFVATPV
jgi:hypothetical protein